MNALTLTLTLNGHQAFSLVCQSWLDVIALVALIGFVDGCCHGLLEKWRRLRAQQVSQEGAR